MNKVFSLDPGGPNAKRLTVTHTAKLTSTKVILDGQEIMSFPTKADFVRGTTIKTSDGSILSVRYGTIEGLVLFKGIHVIRNGAPVKGSAADPVPRWSWIFLGLIILIPVISLGGALPGLIAAAGVAGTISVSRISRWSTAIRASFCAGITACCWLGFLLLASLVAASKGGVSANSTKQSKTVTDSATAREDKLINQIGSTYYKRGYLQSDIDKIKDSLYDHCDTMQPPQCIDYLNKAMDEARNAPAQP
jgi:hypothetical protein